MNSVKTVLIIDDDQGFQFYLSSILQEQYPDIEVLQAYNGEEAIILLKSLDAYPDLVFVDLNMPIMDGYDFLCIHKIQFQAHGSKVIVLTSSQSQKDYQKVLELEYVHDYLEKSTFEAAMIKQLGKI